MPTVYLTAILGSFNDDLILIRCFFNILWSTPIIGLQKIWKSGLLNWAGSDLRSVGRLRDALEPMQLVLEECINQEDWLGAAVNASNFSELLLALGYIEDAQINSHRSIEYADLCDENELFERIGARSTCAYVLHQAGKYKEALNLFKEAEKLQQQDQPEYLFLYSIRGFYFNTLLLDLSKVDDALERTEYDIQISKQNNWMSELALDKLIQSWAYIEQQDFFQADKSLEQAVVNLSSIEEQRFLPLGLLARAALHRHTRDFARARQDLQEVLEITDYSGMRLHLTDYHLEMARLLVAEEKEGVCNTPLQGTADVGAYCIRPLQYHIAEAERLIAATGYHRRDKELLELQQILAAQ